MSNNAFSRRFSSFDIWSRSNSKSTIEETHDRIYPLPTVTSHIAPAMSMQKPMERKVARSLIRICRNIGHCGSMTIPFPSRLFDQFGQSVIDERLRGSLIFFLVSYTLYISLRKHIFLRTFFGSANDLESFEYRSAFLLFSLAFAAFDDPFPFALERNIHAIYATKIKQRPNDPARNTF